MASRVLTIMITDIKGFTERTSQTSREEMRSLLEEHEALLLPMVAKFRGTLVKNIGDSFLVTFESPTNAILCAIMMQDKLHSFNEDKQNGERIQVRIALSSGEVEVREGDVFGECVNIAARIEGIMEASEIYFTEAVYLSMNKAEVPSSEVGEFRLKGIPEQIRVYRVIQDRNSDRYLQLLDRLKTSKFEDVAVPSAGNGLQPVRHRAGSKLILMMLVVLALFTGTLVLIVPTLKGTRIRKGRKSVAEAVEAGDFGLALARADKMMQEFPEEKASHDAVMIVVAAEVDKLLSADKFEEALELIDGRGGERPYLDLSGLRKKVLFAYGAAYSAKANYRVSGAVYRELFDKYPGDIEVYREIATRHGFGYEGGPTSYATLAAYRIAEHSQGPLDTLAGDLLVYRLKDNGPYGEDILTVRKWLIERYPPAADKVRDFLGEDDYEARMNAFYLLKEAGKISPEEEFRHHLRSLLELTSSYAKAGKESVEYFREALKDAAWRDRKQAMAIKHFDDVKCFHGWSSYQEEVSGVLAEAFLEETEPLMLKWAATDDSYERANAFRFLRDAGRLDRIDLWAFHAKTLTNYHVVYTPAHMQDAVNFFAGQVFTERSADAMAALEAGKKYVIGEIEAYLKDGLKSQAESANRGLLMIEKALAAFDALH
ncbi:MAG: adenylate/guanylate cyclase domain-containing protein [Planctomycetes bacterium]|nr:adenylate/guanylate cyclase domain-containing protein [Planctomycetota bacterium]